MKIKFLLVLVFAFAVGCKNYGKLTYLTKLPEKLSENSGIATFNDSTLWVIEDHGNNDNISEVDLKGNLIKKFNVKNAKNEDWEDLTTDKAGNLYIGDFGNNHNNRKDLVIYKLPNPENEKGDKIDAEKIKFRYPEQTTFPPKNSKLNFDAEAFFYRNGFLYVITKNRTIPFTGEAFIYKVPAVKGEYEAQLVGKFITCKEEVICQITAADISQDENTIALLGYGKLWIFTDFKNDDFSKGTLKTIELGATTQLESICFLSNGILLISDEERANTGGNLYSLKIK
ncbi:hypothetical protein [Maribacter sp. HTCC2170]|uniref:hypothetical protein n=1 Tax=Maribacter sp. (strain HTCC2170 / KCCM 42371) TaxID=313603 RepID=UPI00006AE5E5|nr:hypothetical protein [Maribacter sp. HTCC2170]EAR00455.1 hypothetical protein FB2170_08119 [Maribacter sp. HTCC2170]